MRRMFVVLGCLCVLAAPAWAGGDFQVLGAYAETVDTDASLGLGARLSYDWENVALDLSATWFRQSSPHVITDAGAPVTEEFSLTPLELGLRFLFAPGTDFRPYIGVGASYFLVNSRIANVDDELGFYVNAGFLWGPPRGTRVFLEAIYRSADVTADYGPNGSADLDLGGLGAAFGLSFTF